MGQKEDIIQLLRHRGGRGIRSFERVHLKMLQLPARIKELKERGYDIRSFPVEGSREVRYVLFESEGVY